MGKAVLPALAMGGLAFATGGTSLLGTAAVQGAVLPGMAALPGATAGLFGSAGAFSLGTTMGTLGTLGSIASPLLSARSQAQSASFQRAQLSLQAKTQEAQTLQTANEIKRRMIADLASANAAFGARGVSVTSGTPVQAAQEAVRVANRNVDIALTGGQAQQSQNKLQANQFKMAGSSAISGGLFESLSKAGEIL